EEINVVRFAVRRLHVHAGEVFPATEIRQPVVVHPYQIESKILPLVFNVKFPVAALFALRLDVRLDASGNIGGADLLCFGAFGWVFCTFFWMLRMFLGDDQRRWAEKQRNGYCNNKS